jgi:DNA-binding NarL/FixJ family response regulator
MVVENLQALKIAIIDDGHPDLCAQKIKDAFDQAGLTQRVNIDTFTNPREGIQGCREKRYDFVVLDYDMAIYGDVVGRKIREINPQQRLLGFSSHWENEPDIVRELEMEYFSPIAEVIGDYLVSVVRGDEDANS